MIYRMEEPAKIHANIKVIGIGGGGCNAVNRMVENHLAGIDFIAGNTDMQALTGCQAPTVLQLGTALTRGLGAGGNPDIGREAALEDEMKIREQLEGADMVFITAGMGGGTGTGGAPVVAQIAKELGALTIAVVTKPFQFEGRRRFQNAETGIRNLEAYVDTLITIPNQKLLSMVERNTPLTDAFCLADEVLTHAVRGISDLITVPGLINLDFADVQAIMAGMGKALMGTGYGQGEFKAEEAVRSAISSPLLDDMKIEGAKGILINITGGSDLTLVETNAAAQLIQEAADPEANIIFGAVVADNYEDNVKVTVIATGFNGVQIKDTPIPFESRQRRRDYQVTGVSLPTQDSSSDTETSYDDAEVEELESNNSVEQIQNEHIHSEEECEPTEWAVEAEQTESEELEPVMASTPSVHVSDRDPEDSQFQVMRSQHLEQNSKSQRMVHQPELELDNSDTTHPPEDEVTKDIPLQTLTEEEPKRTSIRIPPAQRELDLPESRLKQTMTDKLPPYSRRNLQRENFKKDSVFFKDSIEIESSHYMIPAFLRRKAD